MKIIYFNLIILLIIGSFSTSCHHDKELKTIKNLNTNWVFKQVTDSTWLNATVPGCVHTDLMDNSIIDNPYFRLNERDVQWIDKVDWEYSTTFDVDEEIHNKDVVELVFSGLDTYANIYLNNKLLLETDNMFISWKVNCKKFLIKGENTLRVVFESPINKGLDSRYGLGYFLPGAENDQSELGGLGDKKVCVFTRKPGYHFGWDWGPRLVTSGIWQEIELQSWDIASVVDIEIIQENLVVQNAQLSVNLEIEAVNKSNLLLTTLIDNQIVASQEVNLHKGINNISYPLEIKNPELWWPNGLGDQKLYDIEVKLKDNLNLISANSTTIGLRTVEVVQEPDSVGSNFYFKVNGHPVFMKGANYIPQDVFLTRATDEHYAKLIKSAADANYNMLRVWGGGIYEKDIFYDLCDEAGILVWQDFMFACAMYPGNKEFLENIEKEAVQNVKRLRNHPCIALWCGDNEILSAWNRWGWKDNVLENQGQNIVDTVWKAYDDVFHNILPRIVEKYDSKRLYWSSSPSSGFGKLENGKSGDNHYWGVWWAKEPFSKYEEEIPRFMSEFGFQSFPEFNSVKKYTNEEDWDIYSEVMKSHQRSSIGNATIEEYMLRDYKKPKNFEMFLYVGQLLQARGIRIGIEAHRRAMPYCMGSLYWQLNDCWPVASWSGIDYYGNWKALHYEVREAFKQTIISNSYKDGVINTSIISDKLENISSKLNIVVMDFYGNEINSISKNVEILANSSVVYSSNDVELLTTGIPINKVLIHSVISTNDTVVIDENIHYLVPPKELKLPKPTISTSIEQISDQIFEITIKTDVLAKNVFLQTTFEGHFSDNYFDVLPIGSCKVKYVCNEPIDLVNLKNNIITTTLTDSY